MHSPIIINLIKEVVHKHPDLHEIILDIAALGFRAGMHMQKVLEIAEIQGCDQGDVIDEDITEDEIQDILYETEIFYADLADIPIEKPQYKLPMPVNRIGSTLDEMKQDFPDLF